MISREGRIGGGDTVVNANEHAAKVASEAGKPQLVEELKERLRQARALELMSKEETLRLRLKHVGPSVALFFQENPLKIVQGRGQYLYDELGTEYLDCINNVAHVGHANKRVHEAVSRQLGLLNTNSRFLHDGLALYAKRLTSYFPKHLSVCYLVNSGSEANDLAIRLARAYTRRKDIVSVDGAYHGNVTSTMAISPYKTDKLVDFVPAKWAHVVPMPCMYRGSEFAASQANGGAVPETDGDALGRLYAAAAERVMEEAKGRGRQVAALLVESMISCGGQTPLPTGYLRHLQRYLHANGSLLVCDEVQTGFGRCGKHMWAFQLDGDDIRPDIVTLGKPMGNGFPVSAVVTTPQVAAAFQSIGTEYFNTFGGNPASCAAALAVLDELEERQLMQAADRIGTFVLGELRQLKLGSRIVGDVRGCGLFIGMELVEDTKSKRPAPQYAQYIVQRFRDERILMSTEGKLGNVLKFKPPMVFSMEDARRFVGVLAKALAELEVLLGHAPGLSPAPGSSSSSSSASSSSSSVSSSSWLESSGEM